MTFDAYDRSLQLLRAIAVHAKRLATRDANLTKQLRRAGASVALNIAEANKRAGGDRPHLFRVALGSAAEVTACSRSRSPSSTSRSTMSPSHSSSPTGCER